LEHDGKCAVCWHRDDEPGDGGLEYLGLFRLCVSLSLLFKSRHSQGTVLGEAICVFSLTTFFVGNLIMLIVGPLLVVGLIFLAWRQGKLYWFRKGWGRFPISFVIGAGLAVGLSMLYTYINPYVRSPLFGLFAVSWH
jgi:hypothetical protein